MKRFSWAGWCLGLLLMCVCAGVHAQSSAGSNDCTFGENSLKIGFADGRSGCLKEFLNTIYSERSRASTLDAASRNLLPNTIMAWVANSQSCPMAVWSHTNNAADRSAQEQEVLGKCQSQLDERVQKIGRTPGAACRCEIVLRDGVSPLSSVDYDRRLSDLITQSRSGLRPILANKPNAPLAAASQPVSTQQAPSRPAAQTQPPVAAVPAAAVPAAVAVAVAAPPAVAATAPPATAFATGQVQKPPSQVAQPVKPVATPAPIMANRKALVIGNDSYSHVPKLLNARADAIAIGQALSELGYKVTTRQDLSEKEMKSAIRQFRNEVEGGDEVMIFFAGHGVQLGAANYLLPTDIKGESEDQVRDEAIELQRVLDGLSEKRVKLSLVMIDACRDNPFPKAGRAIGGRGLAPTTAATGQMVVFSAGAGQQALDKLGPADKHPNGLFTRTLLTEIRTPGMRVDNVIREVRKKVVEAARSVGHEQVPAIYDQVVGDFYFKR